MSARLTISSGLGPIEVRVFVAALADALEPFVLARGVFVTHRVVHGAVEAPHSIDLGLVGATDRLTDLVGTHALVARSERRGRRARKRWFASVDVAPTTEGDATPLDPRDVAFETCRSSGAGGQHVQKTASAVRATHRPSGISVRVEDERSQHRNRSVALDRLADALAARTRARAEEHATARRDACLHVERGRPVFVWRQGRNGLEDGTPDAA